MLNLLIISILIGQFGAVWGEILTAPGFIFDWYIRLIDKLPDYVKKPIGWCHYCFAGQIALFAYLYICGDYNIFLHIIFIINAIFFTDIFTKILRYGN
jgi:hypothetical protein